MSEPDSIDLDRVMAEVREEVRARRAAGDFPPSLERDLDRLFDRFVPREALDSDFSEAIQAADRAAYINVAVPTASQKPGVGEVKRVLRKAMAWYLEYLAQQATAFGTASVRAMRALGERQTVIEDQVAQWRPQEDDGRDRPAEDADLSAWVDLALGQLRGLSGRVLHAECGSGALLKVLNDAGIDAYGVDPRGPLVDRAVASGLEAFPDDPLTHLDAVRDGTLAGVLLSGWPDRAAPGRQRRLVDLVARKLVVGGRLVLIAASPEQWTRMVAPLEADLAPGRPLHAVTWAHLLGRAGFGSIEVVEGRPTGGLPRAGAGEAGAASLNQALEVLERVLFGPSHGAVTAVR